MAHISLQSAGKPHQVLPVVDFVERFDRFVPRPERSASAAEGFGVGTHYVSAKTTREP